MRPNSTRPVFLNLLQIRFPPTALASIMHRLAGVLLVLSLPFLIYLLGLSLQNQQSYTTAIKIIQNPLVSFYLYSLLWAISHHFAAGIRYFLVDLDIFISKRSARVSAYVVIVIGILIPVLVFMGRLL